MRSDWAVESFTDILLDDPMHINEMRCMIGAASVALSDPGAWSKRHLILGDNLGVMLALSKGRCRDPRLLNFQRIWSMMWLATGAQASGRWVPSEVNPADTPSRWHDAEAKASSSGEGLLWSAASYERARLNAEHWHEWTSKPHADATEYWGWWRQKAIAGPGGAAHRRVLGKKVRLGAPSHSTLEDSEAPDEASEAGGVDAEGCNTSGEAEATSEQVWYVQPGVGIHCGDNRGSLGQDEYPSGLLQAAAPVRGASASCNLGAGERSGLASGQALRSAFSGGPSKRCWPKTAGSDRVCPSSLLAVRPQALTPEPPGLEGLGTPRAWSYKVALGGKSRHGTFKPADVGGPCGGGSLSGSHVRHVWPAVGDSDAASVANPPTRAERRPGQGCHPLEPGLLGKSVENWRDRREPLDPKTVGRPVPHETSGGQGASRSGLAFRPETAQGSLPACMPSVGVPAPQPLSVPDAPLGRQQRQVLQPPEPQGRGAARPVADRGIGTTLREKSAPAEKCGGRRRSNVKVRREKCGSHTKSHASTNAAGGRASPFFVELFAGAGGVNATWRKLGYRVFSFDVKQGSRGDLLRRAVRKRVRKLVRSAHCLGVLMAPPCASFSTARRPPLRSFAEPMGLRSLSPENRLKVNEANSLFNFCVSIFKLCIINKVPSIWENPRTSMMWWADAAIKTLTNTNVADVTADFCAFGTPWRKRTRFRTCHLPSADHWLGHTCGSGKRCAYTHKPHVILSGKCDHGPNKGRAWTSIAEPYPFKLSLALARALEEGAFCQQFAMTCRLKKNKYLT